MMTRASAAPAVADAPTSVRLDLWLWAARFFRTRALAKQAIETGKVEVEGQRAKPARAVRVGEALRVVRGEEIFEVEVAGLSATRGPARVAQGLYLESDASREARLERLALLRAELALIRERGFSHSNEDFDADARGVGAAIFDASGNVVGGISVGGPSSRIDDALLAEFSQQISSVASLISFRLGHLLQPRR